MQNCSSASRVSQSEAPTEVQAPKGPMDKVGNEVLSKRMALETCVEPASLP